MTDRITQFSLTLPESLLHDLRQLALLKALEGGHRASAAGLIRDLITEELSRRAKHADRGPDAS